MGHRWTDAEIFRYAYEDMPKGGWVELEVEEALRMVRDSVAAAGNTVAEELRAENADLRTKYDAAYRELHELRIRLGLVDELAEASVTQS